MQKSFLYFQCTAAQIIRVLPWGEAVSLLFSGSSKNVSSNIPRTYPAISRGATSRLLRFSYPDCKRKFFPMFPVIPVIRRPQCLQKRNEPTFGEQKPFSSIRSRHSSKESRLGGGRPHSYPVSYLSSMTLLLPVFVFDSGSNIRGDRLRDDCGAGNRRAACPASQALSNGILI